MPSLLDSFLGQQDAPNLSTPTLGEIYRAIAKFAPMLGQTTVDYNKAMAPGIAEAQRMHEDVWDPNKGAIRESAGGRLLELLRDPYAMPPQLSAFLRQQGLEGAAGSGLNASNAGRAGMFGLLGAGAENRASSLLNTGLSYGNNTTNLWQPQNLGVSPGDFGSSVVSLNNQKNSISKYLSDLDYQNTMNLINRPLEIGGKLGNIAGQIIGGVFGTSGMGAGMGGFMGGNQMQGMPGMSFGNHGGMWNPSGNAVYPMPA